MNKFLIVKLPPEPCFKYHCFLKHDLLKLNEWIYTLSGDTIQSLLSVIFLTQSLNGVYGGQIIYCYSFNRIIIT